MLGDDIAQGMGLVITLKQFIEFLTKVERSSECPVCPHDGAWSFYVDKKSAAQGSSVMAVTRMISTYENSPDDPYPVLTMECPNCGYLLLTNANIVAKKLGLPEAAHD